MCGFEYAAACLMLQEGMERQALEIVSAIRARYDGQKRNPWAEIECGGSYVRSLASYSLLLAYSGLIFDLPHQRMGFRPLKPGSYFFCFRRVLGKCTLLPGRDENSDPLWNDTAQTDRRAV